MKIGILSLYKNGYNFGAQLQAYALCKYLQRFGECEQIQYLHQETDLYYWFRDIVGAKKIKMFSDSIPHSREVYDNTTIIDSVDKYDVFVCGSDQIWGDSVFVPFENTAIFALSFVPDDKLKVAYAASMGGNEVEGKYYDILRGTLKLFDYISIREKTAGEFIEKLSEKKVENVVDPVFLLRKHEWDEIAIKPEINEPYDVIYMISDNYSDLSYNSNRKNIHINPNTNNIGPEEFLGFIKYANTVITDSFHGVAFCLIFGKDFIPISKNKKLNVRLEDLFSAFSFSCNMVKKNKCLSSRKYNIKSDSYAQSVMLSCIEKSKSYLYEIFGSLSQESCPTSEVDCIGCGSCISVCEKKCIKLKKKKRGFWFPVIDIKDCLYCNKCKDVCPVENIKRNQFRVRERIIPDNTVYSAKYLDDEIVKISSSGGFFYGVAKYIIDNGGAVYGVRFDKNFNAIAGRATSICELTPLLTSKYMQSDWTGIYDQIKKDIDEGRTVLACGTPCQIAAVYQRFGSYDKLYLVDFICHGVLSNDLWRKYLDYISNGEKVRTVNMRYKESDNIDAEKRTIKISFDSKDDYIQDSSTDLYYSLYLEDTLYRDSCYRCKFRGDRRFSDLTIGDFHGKNDIVRDSARNIELGDSLVFLNTNKGSVLWERVNHSFEYAKQNKEEVLKYNISYYESVKVQCFTSYLTAIYEDASVKKLYDEYLLCRQRKSENVFYWRKMTTERCEKIMERYEDGEIVCDIDILIYGIGRLGKKLYSKLKHKPDYIIDRDYRENDYLNTKITKPNDERISNFSKLYTIVITPISDEMDIIRRLRIDHENIDIINLVDFLENEINVQVGGC